MAASSRMTLACAYRHVVETECTHDVETIVEHDLAKSVFTFDAHAGETIRITKFVSYHSSRGIPVLELADRITVMDAGTVIAEGEPAAIERDSVVQRAYLGR